MSWRAKNNLIPQQCLWYNDIISLSKYLRSANIIEFFVFPVLTDWVAWYLRHCILSFKFVHNSVLESSWVRRPYSRETDSCQTSVAWGQVATCSTERPASCVAEIGTRWLRQTLQAYHEVPAAAGEHPKNDDDDGKPPLMSANSINYMLLHDQRVY